MAYILSLPNDWTIYLEELEKHATDGKAAFRTGWNELKAKGYIERYPVRENNKIVAWKTIVRESVGITLLTDFQEVENLEVENQKLLSTNITKDLNNKNTANQDSLVADFEKLWKLYPNKKGNKSTALRSYKKALKSGTTNRQIQDGIVAYKKYLAENDWQKPAFGSTWFYNERWNDEYETKTAVEAILQPQYEYFGGE